MVFLQWTPMRVRANTTLMYETWWKCNLRVLLFYDHLSSELVRQPIVQCVILLRHGQSVTYNLLLAQFFGYASRQHSVRDCKTNILYSYVMTNLLDQFLQIDQLHGFLSYCMWICRFRPKFVTVYNVYNICKLASGPKAF